MLPKSLEKEKGRKGEKETESTKSPLLLFFFCPLLFNDPVAVERSINVGVVKTEPFIGIGRFEKFGVNF